jgi:hypothetical protein
MIDVAAILEKHKRSESSKKRKLHPAIRITGFDLADEDAVALCDAVDAAAMGSRAADTETTPCSLATSFSRRLDW